MSEFDLSQDAQMWVNALFLWIGFATVVGISARSFLPGKEPSDVLGTLLVGAAGCCVGPLLLVHLFKWNSATFNPIGLVGFATSVACAAVVLLGFRATRNLFRSKSEQ